MAALHSAAPEDKSFLVAWALLDQQVQQQKEKYKMNSKTNTFRYSERRLTKVIEAARVEERFQISSWGSEEGQHDYDRLKFTVQLHAAVLLSDEDREKVALS